MIISRTPYRISFFGGGTDYPDWYRKEGGAVLATSIDKYCYISCRYFPPFFNAKHRIVWSHIETVTSTAEILHPAIREGLRFLKMEDPGLEIHHQGDLPARAGMGSSSSFVVGLIKALTALRGEEIDKHALALKGIELEQEVLQEHVGSQDQVTAAYGGLNHIRFLESGEIQAEKVDLPAARVSELESRLMLFYTGTGRLASEVAAKLVANLDKKKSEIRQIQKMVDQALEILKGDADLDNFGSLLDESWKLKRELSSAVSSPAVEQIYATAIKNGALGGKLLGAGGTGFMLFYVTPEQQASMKKALSAYLHVPFKFESQGSKLIYDGSNDSSSHLLV